MTVCRATHWAAFLLAAALTAKEVRAQVIAGGGGDSGCGFADWEQRTQEVDTVCCSGPNAAADACSNGAPTACDTACSMIL